MSTTGAMVLLLIFATIATTCMGLLNSFLLTFNIVKFFSAYRLLRCDCGDNILICKPSSVASMISGAKCDFSQVFWPSGKCLHTYYRRFNITCPNLEHSCFCGITFFSKIFQQPSIVNVKPKELTDGPATTTSESRLETRAPKKTRVFQIGASDVETPVVGV